MTQFSHTDNDGKARMVDVSQKPSLLREASAQGFIRLQPETLKLINENLIKKGDVLAIAEIAGVQAAKETSRLIPLCHPLVLSHVVVSASLSDKGVSVHATVRCTGNTGVEMEALTAVNIALLTVYDMCKAVDKEMEIGNIRLLEKTKTPF
jgi:cyclic pyranopterin phosphate synthase